MKVFIVLTFLFITNVVKFQTSFVTGRVIDEKMKNLLGAEITNLRTHQHIIADTGGFYHIKASVGDTLIYKWVGCTPEIRVINGTTKHINVLLMNKTVNDLGAIWTKRQWEKANNQTLKTYKKLEAQAKRMVNGNINSCYLYR